MKDKENGLLIRRADTIQSGEITSHAVFLRRREFLRRAGWAVAGAALPATLACGAEGEALSTASMADGEANPYRTEEEPTAY
ncbi:MAG: hypothetical protein JRD03_10255, partial [Deltaproteobacteria bacterium]|nr:hypothetical protein [Deltaproteobacteria bacterium]